ncbi:uncharacterized protein LOC105210067 [Zeugodacus cucurbitae]|uniref:Uncharacterized protein ywbO n=1 Tax=Zeugodacus cucurbitae TaxID=28588 RepID=A0A0A1WR33_ZEUCU|nr:uncharacterized protein LOC105210067 [Zeugodacus cucurbitae]XP_028894788.2 uncharacterized protein LOC105210067 [Zeugodacus cucurbitae]
MSEKSSNIISNGELEIVKITEELYDDAVKLFTDNFMQQENACIATEVPSSPQAIAELQGFCRELLTENISFAARNIANGELAAIAINHLMSAKPDNLPLFGSVQQVQSPSVACINDFLQRIEINADIYKTLQVDCVFEIVFLSTSTKYVKRGLASALSECSIEYARRLQQGTVPPEDLPAEKVRALKPSAVCSVFTSIYTQRIGRKFNFEILNQIPYTEFSFEGKTFAERIDPKHTFSTFEALRL